MIDVRREQRAIRRRILQVLIQRRLTTTEWTLPHQTRRQSGVSAHTGSSGQPARAPLAQASISSTGRIPTDS